MTSDIHRIEAGPNRLGLELDVGHLVDVSFEGRKPLHAVPWRDDPAVQADVSLPLVDRRLSCDFFALPFGGEHKDHPPHGWSAQSRWTIETQTGDTHWFSLDRKINGAAVRKAIRLHQDAPIVTQKHVIEGGQGALGFAHHPMIRMLSGGRLFTSPKRAVLTPDPTLEVGMNWLPYGQRSDHFGVFHGCDMTKYPTEICEDFAICVEAQGAPLGWSALLRKAEDDIVLILKRPEQLPITMLWYSNGGRGASPWNGQHRGVLGIEDGCATALVGEQLEQMGVATCRTLGAAIEVDHAIISLARPSDWQAIKEVTLRDGEIVITGDRGQALTLPFDTWI